MICSEIAIAGRITTFCEMYFSDNTKIKQCPSITAYLPVSLKLLMSIATSANYVQKQNQTRVTSVCSDKNAFTFSNTLWTPKPV